MQRGKIVNKKKYEDVKIGNTYGKWTVVGDYIKNEKNGNRKWLCQCSCEKHTIRYVDEHQLKTGKSLSCGCLKKENPDNYNTSMKQSLYDWCIENNRQDILDRWDYELNKRSPKTVGVNSSSKFWFKCLENKNHKSEYRYIKSLKRCDSSFECSQCNSFGQWCLDNGREDLLDRLDYELNNKNPFEISRGSDKKYWLKCPEGIHDSELQTIKMLQKDKNISLKCRKCNSFAQWGIDNLGDDFLEKYWDYKKNKEDPWLVERASRKKVWIKCQEKEYHGSYSVTCSDFSTKGNRCPYCSTRNGKVHPFDSIGGVYLEVFDVWSDKNEKTPYDYTCCSGEKVWVKCLNGTHEDHLTTVETAVKCEFRCPECQREKLSSNLQDKVSNYIINKYNYILLHEFNCTIKPINPITNHILPFDNEIKELKLIIEVHGEQHYKKKNLYNKLQARRRNISLDELFEERRNIDNFKKNYALNNGYCYLEIPYVTEKDGLYKKLIDDKINEILNKNLNL